jgi:hypothetical protein
VFLHLKARVRVGRGIPHSKDSLSLLTVQYSKDICVKVKYIIKKICHKDRTRAHLDKLHKVVYLRRSRPG